MISVINKILGKICHTKFYKIKKKIILLRKDAKNFQKCFSYKIEEKHSSKNPALSIDTIFKCVSE